MFHKAIDLKYLEGTSLAVTFQDGTVRKFDMASLYGKYPQLKALEDRSLFESGKLSWYGIIWNDNLDISTEAIYDNGEIIEIRKRVFHEASSSAVVEARIKVDMTQKKLAELSGVDQADISRIERGIANPSVSTLERIAEAVGGKLKISIVM